MDAILKVEIDRRRAAEAKVGEMRAALQDFIEADEVGRQFKCRVCTFTFGVTGCDGLASEITCLRCSGRTDEIPTTVPAKPEVRA